MLLWLFSPQDGDLADPSTVWGVVYYSAVRDATDQQHILP